MGLPWVRLDATFPHNRKILELIHAKRHRAVNLYVFALAWSGHQETDGAIPAYALPVIHGTRTEAKQLVDAGLWHEDGNGWSIHDWDAYQPSSAHRSKVRDGLYIARCAKGIKAGRPCVCGQH